MSTLLLAYDGSADAEAAVRAAQGALFPGATAVIVTARRDPITFEHASEAALVAVPQEVLAGGVAALNRPRSGAGAQTMEAGARLATAAGARRRDKGAAMIRGAWRALRRVDEIDADVVVCGSRGLGAFSRAAVGSTSTGLLHHAGRPVLVVPSDTGQARRPLVISYDGSEQARDAIAGAGRLLAGRRRSSSCRW